MEFLSLAKQRCSVRKYKTDEIEKEKLDKILEAARIAPTAANAQSQRLLVISSQEAKEKLSKGVIIMAPRWLSLYVGIIQMFLCVRLIKRIW